MTRARGCLVVLLVLVGSSLDGAWNVAAEPSGIRFTDATVSSGIDFTMICGKMPPQQILEVNGGGVAMFDYDQDGDLDLFFANGATMDAPEKGPGSRLYANNGDGTFQDVTAQVGIDLKRWANGVAVGDYDGDGFDDIYVPCYGANVLLRNEAHGKRRRFVDATEQAGVGDSRWGASAAFSDIDRDGDLDLYLVNYFEFDLARPPERRSFKGVMVFGGPMGTRPQADVLYENLGGGKFRDVTASSGCTPAAPGYGLGTLVLDLDRDGRQDILVGNDSTVNFLFHNRGEGKFREIGAVSGLCCNADGRPQATMGIAVGDVDGNGYPDLFTTNFSSDTNTLHANLGGGLFEDRTSRYGLAAVSRPFLSWGTGFYDFDSDGDEDLFVASGHIYPQAADRAMDTDFKQPALLFERLGQRFSRNTDAGPIFRTAYSGRSVAFGDIDDDGDVDIVMTTLGDRVRVFRNDSPLRPALVVELRGKGGNRRGLGGMIELITGDTIQRRWIRGGSYQSVDAPLAYFGLGPAAQTTVKLRVTWPAGNSVEYEGIPVNRRVLLVEGTKTARAVPLAGRKP